MPRALYKITSEIYMTHNSVFVVKVNNDDFCYTDTCDCAKLVLSKLANSLVDELNDEPSTKSGWVQIYRDTTERDVIIGKIALGRLYNGAKEPIYTLTYREVSYGMVRLPPRPQEKVEEKVEEKVVEEKVVEEKVVEEKVEEVVEEKVEVVEEVPRVGTAFACVENVYKPEFKYAETFPALPETPQYATFEFLAEPVPKVAEVSFAPRRQDRQDFNIDNLIAELKVTLSKIKVE